MDVYAEMNKVQKEVTEEFESFFEGMTAPTECCARIIYTIEQKYKEFCNIPIPADARERLKAAILASSEEN